MEGRKEGRRKEDRKKIGNEGKKKERRKANLAVKTALKRHAWEGVAVVKLLSLDFITRSSGEYGHWQHGIKHFRLVIIPSSFLRSVKETHFFPFNDPTLTFYYTFYHLFFLDVFYSFISFFQQG